MDHSGHNMPGHHMAPNPVLTARDATTDSQPVVTGPESLHSMTMKMYFHIGFEKDVLFAGWDADTEIKMIGTVAAVFLLALVFEWIKFYRIRYSQLASIVPAVVRNRGLGTANGSSQSSGESRHSRWLSLPRLIESLLYAVQVAISFTLMLLVMTFNVWILLGTVLGMMTGYALFASSSRLMPGNNSEDCCT